jgi:Ni,Fe-hydrogenase III large subunit/Ni,Fe-hydrogenase III component G
VTGATGGPAPLSGREVARERLVAEVAALLDLGYRCRVVSAENTTVGDTRAEGVQIAYTLVRPAVVASAGEERLELRVRVPVDDAWVPSTAVLSYPAGRFEREIRDLFGVEPRAHPLPRRLVRHAHWPRGWHPLLGEPGTAPDFGPDVSAFPFLEVGGDGVYEIPVGPVHAGIIEPGHFRFSVVGETIIRMKARLWYLHRGVERHFEGRQPQDAVALAERVSGDTAVGHGVAFASACEDALGVGVPVRERLIRAMLLELERLHNHVSDIGAILNDVAFGLAHAHTQRIRENLLRLNASVTGHRLLRGAVRVGGAGVLALPDLGTVVGAAAQAGEVVRLALDHPMVLDRLTGTAVLRREDAVRMGVLGYVARASGVDQDARRDHPFVDLGPGFEVVTETAGDVLARLVVRAREIQVAAAVVVDLCERLDGDTGQPRGTPPADRAHCVESDPADRADPAHRDGAVGLGIVEAWRGTAVHRVVLGPDGRLARVKVVDPSFMNWPALPVALVDTIVPDFPLANKSFNQSYAGNDL